jgi:hypothetical protein
MPGGEIDLINLFVLPVSARALSYQSKAQRVGHVLTLDGENQAATQVFPCHHIAD